MIAADQFLHCDVRMRQAKMQSDLFCGGLALNICGDFLQLPPVDKDGSRPSLAMDLDAPDLPPPDNDDTSAAAGQKDKRKRVAESRQGRALWLDVRRVVSLSVNVRAPDALGRLQAEMRGPENE